MNKLKMSLITSTLSNVFRFNLVYKILSLVFASSLSLQVLAIESVAPRDVGISESRAEIFRAELQRRVDAGELPGAVFMAVRNGKIAVHQAVGFQDRAAKIPMKPDSIFRIASMTKPIVSTAILMLSEQGKNMALPNQKKLSMLLVDHRGRKVLMIKFCAFCLSLCINIKLFIRQEQEILKRLKGLRNLF